MATFFTDEENDKQNEQANQPLVQSTASKSLTSGGQASAGTQAASAGGGPSSSGSFVDIGKYYEAGKDNAQKVQQQVAGGLEQRVEGAKQQLGQEVTDYQQQVQQFKAKPETFQGRDITQIDQAQFGKIFENPYVQNFTSNQGLGSLRQASSAIKNTNTAAGRAQALRNIAASGYSAGESNLDQALLNRAERDKNVLGGLQQRYGQGFIDQQTQQAQAQAAQARQEVEQQRQATREQARTYVTNQQQALQDLANRSAAQNTAARQAEYTNMLRDAWTKGLEAKRRSLVDDVTQANIKSREDFEKLATQNAATAFGGGAQLGTAEVPKSYRGDFSLVGPKNFEEALAQLASTEYGLGNVSRGATLTQDQLNQLDAYNRLSGIAQAGGSINLGNTNALGDTSRDAAAAQALQNLIRYGGVQEYTGADTLTQGGRTQQQGSQTFGGIAGGMFRTDKYGNVIRAPEGGLSAENLGFGQY